MNPMLIHNASLVAALLIAFSGCAQSQTTPAANGAAAPAAAASTPLLQQMKIARVNGKLSVPVEVRYQFAREPVRNQSTMLDLALVPRIAGENLRIDLPESKSVTINVADEPLVQQKADAAQVIRRKLFVTPLEDAGEVRLIVSMDAQGGRYFGVFSIPIRN